MPALDINLDVLEDKGFIKVLNNNDYLTVQGRLYLAHSSGQLIGVTTEEMYPDDAEFITIKATVAIYNPLILAQIEKIAASETIKHDQIKENLANELIYNALISEYTGMAQSKRKGGKSAEGTNPREVAETSAVGRALGNAGFGDTESFASFEEMMVALSRDGSEEQAKPAAKPAAKKLAAKKAADPNKPTADEKKEFFELAQKHLGVETVEDFTAKVEALPEAEGKKLGAFTKDDIERVSAALVKLPPF